MKKRLFCVLLCTLLLAGLSVCAFAEQEAMSAGEELALLPEVNVIPTPVTTVRDYTGSPFAITDFIGADESILTNAVLREVNGHDVQTEPVAILNAGTYTLRFCANSGYVFAEPDESDVPDCSWKTVEVTVLPAAIPTLKTQSAIYDGEVKAIEKFFGLILGFDKDVMFDNTKILSINGGEPFDLIEGGVYDVCFEITNPNYFFAEPDDPNAPAVKTYKLEILVTVRFDVGGLPIVKPEDQTVSKGSKAAEPADPVAEGYDFDGWFKEFACTNRWNFETDTVEKDTMIYAKFTKLYSVTFDVQGHGAAPAALTIRNGELVSEPATPEAEDFLFDGWFKDAACTDAWNFAEDQVRADTVLYARWTEPVTVTFDAQGHGTAPAAQKVVKGGKAAEPEELTADGFEFGGWFKDAACTDAWDFETDKVESDVTLYAKWTKGTKMCTVTFNVQGHGKAPAAQTVAQGSKIIKPTNPSATGYFFVGWYIDKTCKTQWKFNTNTVEKDMVLYAKWTSNNPRTGDTENLGFYAALSLCSLAAAAVFVLGSKKRREK